MKNRTDKILLAVFLLSLAVYLVNFAVCFSDLPLDAPPWQQMLLLYFHFIPMFCLQLLLCRRTRRRVAAIPALVIVGAALLFAYGYFTATGWDTLGWGILLVLSIAPAAGCVLAWAAYGCWSLYRKGDIRNA